MKTTKSMLCQNVIIGTLVCITLLSLVIKSLVNMLIIPRIANLNSLRITNLVLQLVNIYYLENLTTTNGQVSSRQSKKKETILHT